jgi:hypothetical protein
LHGDEQGVIGVLSVFAVLALTLLLGMVMNVGRSVDAKVRLQNTADGAALSGGVVIARGMNLLAFTNHMLFDVFALTAYCREARDEHAEKYVPEILAAWDGLARVFARATDFPKFPRLGRAIPQKTPVEREYVRAFCEWAAAASEKTLPVLEDVLREEMIPKFQRAVVETYPGIAQEAAMRIAQRDGSTSHSYGQILGVLWRPDVSLVGQNEDPASPSLPAVDPTHDTAYRAKAQQQRRHYAMQYLGTGFAHGTKYSPTWRSHYPGSWTVEEFWLFDNAAKMCQFGNLFRCFACGQLNKLLDEEYPETNLPHMIRVSNDPGDAPLPFMVPEKDNNDYLARYFTFLGAAYRQKLPQMSPTKFINPMSSDAVAYAEIRVFVPNPRLQWCDSMGRTISVSVPGMGDMPTPPPEDAIDLPGDETKGKFFIGRRRVPWWNLLNQNWTVQLVPTTQPRLAEILQTPPMLDSAQQQFSLPDLGGLNSADIERISPH